MSNDICFLIFCFQAALFDDNKSNIDTLRIKSEKVSMTHYICIFYFCNYHSNKYENGNIYF